ncbi:MAG: hypothetical protein NVS3B21_15090 [Acidimicrobiales bacterium]
MALRLRHRSVPLGLALLLTASACTRHPTHRSGPSVSTAVVRSGSELVAEQEATPLAATPPPLAYRITYQVTEAGSVLIRETTVVSRPFDTAKETVSGGRPISRQEASFGRLAIRSEGSAAVVLRQPPLAPDARGEVVVAGSGALGLERRERRRIASGECDVYRVTADADQASLSRPSGADFSDLCLDASGLLREQWKVKGNVPVMQRVALSVEALPSAPAPRELRQLPDAATVAPRLGGGFVRKVTSDSMPATRFFILDAPPEGFGYMGRYSVIPPQPGAGGAASQQSAPTVASVADVWTRGADYLVLDQGGTLDGREVFAPDPAASKIAVGAAGPGEASTRLIGAELRVQLGGGHFLRLYGSATAERLASVAQGLRSTPGGSGLTYAEPDTSPTIPPGG